MIKWTDEMLEDLKVLKRDEFKNKYGVSRATQVEKAKELGCIKRIKWTESMKKELLESKVAHFAARYNMSVTSAWKKKQELSIAVEVEDNNPVTIKTEVRVNKKLEMLFSNYASYISCGERHYLQNLRYKLSQSDKKLSDLAHHLEINVEKLSDMQLVEISKNIAEIRRERRLVKDELEFLYKYKDNIKAYSNFDTIIDEYLKTREARVYKTRLLKKSLGKIQMKAVDRSMTSRLLELEKNNIQYERDLERKAKGVSYIDRIDKDYVEKFKKLSRPIRAAILEECKREYRGVKVPEVKNYVIWHKILPNILIKKGLFITK